MLFHFPKRAIDGRWYAVYYIPGTGELSSVFDSPNQAEAQSEANRLNHEQIQQTTGLRQDRDLRGVRFS